MRTQCESESESESEEEYSAAAAAEQSSQDELQELRKRYPAEAQPLITRAFAAIATTRKSGKVATSILAAEMRKWSAYPVSQVLGAIQEYLERDCAGEGKREAYLYAMIRNWRPGEGKAAREGPGPGKPGNQEWLQLIEAMKTTADGGTGWKQLHEDLKEASKVLGDWSWWRGLTDRELGFKKQLFLDALAKVRSKKE
jgi:hypothetical protein